MNLLEALERLAEEKFIVAKDGADTETVEDYIDMYSDEDVIPYPDVTIEYCDQNTASIYRVKPDGYIDTTVPLVVCYQYECRVCSRAGLVEAADESELCPSCYAESIGE